MEDQVEGLVPAVLLADGLLDLLQHGRPQLHMPRLVDAVHVAERGGQDVPAALAEPERFDRGQGVLRRAVQLLVDLADDAVFLTADDADLEFHDGVRGGALGQHLGRDLQVLLQRHGRAVPHVRLEQRLLPPGHPLLGDRDQRAHEAVELVLRAVVGVQRDVDRVLSRDDVRELGQRDRAGHHVLDRLSRQVLGAAGRYLNDPVTAGVGEAAQRGVERLA